VILIPTLEEKVVSTPVFTSIDQLAFNWNLAPRKELNEEFLCSPSGDSSRYESSGSGFPLAGFEAPNDVHYFVRATILGAVEKILH
jgi:hypothetical protein